MLATLLHGYMKIISHFKNERQTEVLQTVRQVPNFMIVLIPYINLLSLPWVIKCLFLRNMEPLKYFVEQQTVSNFWTIVLRS